FGGAPARPEQVGDGMVAAWLASDAGAMWTEAGGQVGLEVEASQDGVDEFAPVIQTGGNRAVLSETSTGMLWTVPDGRLIPTAQWDLVDPPKQVSGTVVSEATEQKPPVAVNDAFGVRAGEPVPLPVLLNDYDPNRSDVLTIVPDGLGEGLPEDFGQVELLSDGQGLMLQPSPAASGSAVFSYRITDGVAVSEPARVELRVVGEETNTAPQWCPVVGCQRSWPSPTIVPGGTLVLPVLEGWVDAEGDPMMLTDATLVDDQDPARALVTADGRLAVRHTDPNAADGEISVQVRVAGSRGGSTERTLRIGVRADAVAEIEAIAATVATGQPTTVHPLNRVSGGSGSFALVDAAVQSGTVRVVANPSAGTVSLTAQTPGNSLVSVTVRDTVTKRESNGVIRVTAMEERPALALPPLRAFVRPLGDTTIEVLDAIPGASSRSLSVRSATVVAGELRADVIEHARIRLSGSTADGQPGLIGSAEVVVAEGERIARGRITVFQVPEVSSAGAIAVADAATVRAGSVVDIPVLDNDVAAPGERLVLHPEVSASGAEGELAFVSGRRLRYLAPDQPGTYTLGYTTYGASSPRRSDVGTVQVTVIAAGANTDPKPASLIVRVAPGERVNAVVPVSNIDPDGDRVRLVDVEQPAEAQLSATILPRTGTIQVSASANAEPSEEIIGYTVRDGFGGEGVGRLRIIVTEPDPAGGAPVVYSDYVRMERGVSEPVAVRPLDNDVDPAGGALELVEVVPNAPGGRDSALYRELAARLDTSALGRGIVTIAGSDESGTVSFRYVVRSRATGSTSDGLIVVQVSDRIGRQAPNVQDTVLTVKDRADLTGGGVDVVTGRVQWATGDISKLRLSLWGEAAGRYRVSGSSISGEYRPEGDLVAFRLTGRDAAGVEVSGYGFLIVPPLDELRLTLKAGAAPLSVEEGRSVEADVRELLDLGSGDDIVLDGGAFGVQRSQAACSAIGDTTIRYAAGREAPWRDACMIRVRLAEQTVFTVLPIPIDIVPDDPTVQLHPLGRTIAPGETQTIELAEMLTWQGGRTGDAAALSWRIAGEGVFEFGPLDPASGRLAVTAP
ncbi:Ig-like domain-containing protein, partial [Leucobacter soli]